MFYQLFDAVSAAHAAGPRPGLGDTTSAVTVLAEGEIKTDGFGQFLRSQVFPPVLAVGAILLLGKALKAQWSGVVTVVGLSLVGLAWFGLSAKPDVAISAGEALARLFIPGV